MTNDRVTPMFKEQSDLEAAIAKLQRAERNGDGGDGGNGMEHLVRKLETDLGFIKGKLEDMPTKDWVTTRLIWVVVAVSSIGALIEAGGRLIP